MKVRSFIWRAIDTLLAPTGYELRSRQAPANVFTMQGALERAVERGAKVQTVVDIGAASGRWTRKALPLFPAAQFFLLEPLEERREELEALRREHPRVGFQIAAAGANIGEAALTVTPDLDGSGIYDSASPLARRVPLTTLDVAMREKNLSGPFLLKFDTHGFELPILTGASETLRETALIVMEVYNFQLTAQSLRFHEMCAHLETLGFRCADMADVSLRPKDRLLWQADFVFLRKSSPLFAYPAYR
ncbi:MAG TPA: FkbM family methyltransferase [Chthoniobacteraceae bacterium]|jgi:FkbM family methyltransferase